MDSLTKSVEAILRDPVTLGDVDLPTAQSESATYLRLRPGGLSRKNDMEIEHFRRAFAPLPATEKLYTKKIRSLPRPETSSDSIVLDIGCGPYDCISAMLGTHVFLDDIMNLYVEEIGARFAGLPICARTELMPFVADSIDVLYSVNMLDHVDDMPATLAEMHRILSPEGRLYCQSYFNSHPLLETEPGVFDRSFYDDYVLPLFEVEHAQTYAVGDPAISRSYTMDIIGMVLKKRVGVVVDTKPRNRYLDATYFGPQSHISFAIGSLAEGHLDKARGHIDALAAEPFYWLQRSLLTAELATAEEDFATANQILKELASDGRVRGNALARVAVVQAQSKRVRAANVKLRAANKRLREAAVTRRSEGDPPPPFFSRASAVARRVGSQVRGKVGR